jgi:NhaP-type Na+/H+ or K+/H+ antiporter
LIALLCERCDHTQIIGVDEFFWGIYWSVLQTWGGALGIAVISLSFSSYSKICQNFELIVDLPSAVLSLSVFVNALVSPFLN